MTLIKCPKCGKEISDKANSCPHCGNDLKIKQKKHKKDFYVISIISAILSIFLFVLFLVVSENVSDIVVGILSFAHIVIFVIGILSLFKIITKRSEGRFCGGVCVLVSGFWVAIVIYAVISTFSSSSDNVTGGGTNSIYEQINDETNAESKKVFNVNKTVYEDDLITLKCKEIISQGVVFEVVNKTKFEIEWLNLLVSLDGIDIPMYSEDNSDQNIAPNETRDIILNGETGTEHYKMSISGNIFIDGTSKGEIDVCDFVLGGKENITQLECRKKVYEDEDIEVYYNDIVIDTLDFCIENKMDHAITVGFWGDDELEINGEKYGSSVVTINAHSKGNFIGQLYRMDEKDVQITQVDSFKGKLGVKDIRNNDIKDITLDFSDK